MLEGLRRWARKLGRRRADAAPPGRAQTGREGERLAARHLERRGYRIIERNYRIPRGEIDLVAFLDGLLVFVEVRSRNEPGPLRPVETVTYRKQKRILTAAEHYLFAHRARLQGIGIRFDVMTVCFREDGREPEVRHVENAFSARPKGYT